MPHLNETEFIDLLEGRLEGSRTAHAAGCAECAAQLDVLRGTLASIDKSDAKPPSPLFWDRFPSRVEAAIEQRPRVWFAGHPAFLTLGLAAAVLVAVIAAFVARPGSDSPRAVPAVTSAPDPSLPLEQNPDQDPAWAAVRTAADDLDYDDALAAGISAGPGTAERAAMELSDEQRAELLRLIEREIKRAGGA